MSDLILIPRPVPPKLWGKNLRNELGGYRWQKEVSKPIRNEARECELCGSHGSDSPGFVNWRFCCDEVWGYDDEKHHSFLVDLQSVCWWCNAMIHAGYTARKHKNLWVQVLNHAMLVNDCTPDELLDAIAEQQALLNARSADHVEWTISWENWEEIRDAKLKKLRESKSDWPKKLF